MEPDERIPTMKKVLMGLILLTALGPACVLPLVTMDKYKALQKEHEDNIKLNNENVELCQKVYEKLIMCSDTLETCLQIVVPNYESPKPSLEL